MYSRFPLAVLAATTLIATASAEDVAPAATQAASAGAFNPAISAVLQGSFNAYSRNPDEAVIRGFALSTEAGPDSEGFSLGESEINLSSNIDTLFFGSLTAALHDQAGSTEISLEEAYLQTLSLPYGATVKAGRMFPVFGYLNEIHAHADAFVDRPLPYRAFLGGDNFRDDGLQLSVVLPTVLYAEIGGGAYRGTGFPAAGSGSDGTGTQTLFGRLGGDIGVSQSWFAGLSYLRAKAVDRVTGDLLFNGTTDLYAADAKYTWAPNGNLANQSLTLQGEYLWRREHGDYNGTAYRDSADGWYAQAVYKFRPQWRVGYRYSRLGAPGVPAALAGTALDSGGGDPHSHSLLLEWDHSEFSSLRLQYTRDDSGPVTDDQVVLRYTISMGAHGAHQY
ncbi:MAG: hypothetical protein ABI661_00665 [Gammaproteobacteria bacterium]